MIYDKTTVSTNSKLLETKVNRIEIIFIDPGIDDYQTLINGVNAGIEIHILDSKQDGVLQITNILQQRTDLDAIHIISHGNIGYLSLGNTVLSTDTLNKYQHALFSWQTGFKKNTDIFIYGCNVANGKIGRAFIDNLAIITGANIAASDDLTGNSALGGDWKLACRCGQISDHQIFEQDALEAYNGILATPAISIDNANLAYTENASAIQIDAAATLSDADGDGDWNSGTLIAQITGNHEANDQLSIVDNTVGSINTSGTNILNGATIIGTLSASEGTVTNGTALTINFNANATNALVQQVARAIHYSSTSDDPGTSNRTITFTATDTNADSNSDTRTVSVTAVNDEPTLTATGSSPTFTEGGAAASLFSGSSAASIESGQTLSALTLTVTNVNDGANEILNTDGTAIVLTNGTSGTTATNSLSYSVAVAGTTATVSLSGGTVSTAATQTLVNAISYQNNSQNPDTSNRVVTISSIQDSGGTANSGDNTAALAIASTVTVVGVNDEPTLTATGSDPTFTEGGAAASLFSGSSASTIESGQTLSALTLTVTNVNDGANEILNTDGTAIVLTNGTSGTTATNSLSYSVSVAGTTATVSFSGGTLSTAATQTLADDISYQNNSNTPNTSNRVVTITSMQDSGGTANSGDDTTALSISSTVTVTDATNPTITSATYDATAGSLVVTGTNIQAKADVTNDITSNKLTFTGEGGATYTLTDSTNVERDSATQFTVSLSATDKTALNQIINKDGTSSTSATTYNLEVADDWNANVTDGDTSDTTGNSITISNVASPTISSSTYDASTGVLVVTGNSFLKKDGASNDIDVSLFTFSGEGGETYTLTDSADVEITSSTEFTVTLSAIDKAALNQSINKNGIASTSAAAYNLAAAEDWAVGADVAVNVVDATDNGITVSNVALPAITSSTYDAVTGALVVTGTGFLKIDGAANDVDASKFTFAGEGGVTYTLTDSANVEITSGTAFTVTLSATDKTAINLLLNKSGTASTDATTYNLAAAEDWTAGADAAVNVVDATGNGVTVTVPTTTPTPEPTITTNDGVTTSTTVQSDGTVTTTIPIVDDIREDDPTTTSSVHADIPITTNSEGDATLIVSVPVGVGLSVDGQPQALNKADAINDLIQRIENKTEVGSKQRQEMTDSSQAFLDTLAADEAVSVQTIVPMVSNNQKPNIPIIITGSKQAGDGNQALVIDVTNLPSGTILQLDNVAFAAIVGAVRVLGGAGQNFVIGDDKNQFIVLGADDDRLFGGDGDDTVGSLGGDDRAFGDAGNDVVYGGSANDTISGGSGNDQLNGGFGFDIALQAGQQIDYQIEAQGNQIILTHINGDIDTIIDAELVLFDSGPSLSITHSAKEAAAHHLVSTWFERNLTAEEGSAVQNLQGVEVADIVRTFLELPEAAALQDKTTDELLVGLDDNPNIIQLDVIRDFIGGDNDDQGYLPLGLALHADGNAGYDVLRMPNSRSDVHLETIGDNLEITNLNDGAMLSITDVEAIAFDSDETVILTHNAIEGTLARLMHTFLDRNASIEEWQAGRQALADNVEVQVIFNWFQDQTDFDQLSDSEYIQALFQNTLQRSATTGEVNGYLTQLNDGSLNRDWIGVDIAQSEEAIAIIGSVVEFNGGI